MYVNYEGSGIKTLRVASILFCTISIVAAFLLIPVWTVKESGLFGDSIIIWGNVVTSLILFVTGIFVLGLGLSIATIADNSLHLKRKRELEEEKL